MRKMEEMNWEEKLFHSQVRCMRKRLITLWLQVLLCFSTFWFASRQSVSIRSPWDAKIGLNFKRHWKRQLAAPLTLFHGPPVQNLLNIKYLQGQRKVLFLCCGISTLGIVVVEMVRISKLKTAINKVTASTH